jgi:hypothetical protein
MGYDIHAVYNGNKDMTRALPQNAGMLAVGGLFLMAAPVGYMGIYLALGMELGYSARPLYELLQRARRCGQATDGADLENREFC